MVSPEPKHPGGRDATPFDHGIGHNTFLLIVPLGGCCHFGPNTVVRHGQVHQQQPEIRPLLERIRKFFIKFPHSKLGHMAKQRHRRARLGLPFSFRRSGPNSAEDGPEDRVGIGGFTAALAEDSGCPSARRTARRAAETAAGVSPN